MISNAEARILIRKKLAVIHKIYPFTIRLRDNSCVSNDRTYTVKLDPGSRQMCRVDKYGFPRTSAKASKIVEGFQTGDMVKAIVPSGLKQGVYLGKVAVRSSGYFNIQTKTKTIQGIGHQYCHIIQRSDGYSYNYKEREF